MKKIIDVSSWQGTIDWAKVKPFIDGVILRAGWGHNNIDPQFKKNIEACNKLGIPVGVYWFSYAYTDSMAKNEASYCYEAIKPYKLQLPVYYDWEYDSMNYAKKCGYKPTKSQITNWNKIWCDFFKGKNIPYGYYLNRDYMNNYIDIKKLSGSQWFALYGTVNKPSGSFDIWQYGTERYSGIDGAVDSNYVYNDSIIKVNVAPKAPTSTKKGYTGLFPRLPLRGYFQNKDKGVDVTRVQNFLLWFNPKCLPKYGADGSYGAETANAVTEFQKAVKIKADGKFGKDTLAKAKEYKK